MADDPTTSSPFSLKRWSQRKLAAARKAEADADVLPSPAATPVVSPVAIPDVAPPMTPEAVPLPPVESLTFESDFAPFMQPKIDEATKRAALKKLFSDPSFNVMDGLDIYVGDYTQADPMPAGMLEKLAAAYKMLDPAEPLPAEAKGAGDVAPSTDAETTPSAQAIPAADAAPAAGAPPGADGAAPVTSDPSESGLTGAGDADAAERA